MNKFEPQCKTKAQVHREWARVLEMCEGTNVQPLSCYKKVTETIYNIFDAGFNSSPECYEFAIAIVEGRPVFRGDRIFRKNPKVFESTDFEVLRIDANGGLIDSKTHQCLFPIECTWNRPKKTISLIDVPCPHSFSIAHGITQGPNAILVTFETSGDCDVFAEKIRDAAKIGKAK